MKELRGKEVSDAIGAEIREKLSSVEVMLGRKPRLAIVRCGERPEDLSYERNAVKAYKRVRHGGRHGHISGGCK